MCVLALCFFIDCILVDLLRLLIVTDPVEESWFHLFQLNLMFGYLFAGGCRECFKLCLPGCCGVYTSYVQRVLCNPLLLVVAALLNGGGRARVVSS